MNRSYLPWCKSNQKKKLEVFFSEQVFKDVLLEIKERISTETGGLFLGQIIDNFWIVLEVIDPGPKATFSNSLFEYDHEYQEHLANKIARKYESLEILGLWHKHPGTFNDFSSTDFDTFTKFIDSENRGILSGLVNLIPEFQFVLYYIEKGVKNYCTVEYQIKEPEYLKQRFGIKQKKVEELISNVQHVSLQIHNIDEGISFDIMKPELPFLKHQIKEPTVFLPIEYIEKKYYGDLYGFYNISTNIYNISEIKHPSKSQFLGKITNKEMRTNEFILQGYHENDNLIIKNKKGEKCILKTYSLIQDIFSRNSGIIESDKLLNKKILISGCGSVGSYAAIELAKLGIGHFVFVDNDIFSYNNICRHQCGIEDVGMYKVDAVANKIKLINPRADIKTFNTILQNLSKEDFKDINKEKIDMILGAADNREADLYANKISQLLDIPFVSIGFWERAFMGEIFYSIPGKSPCYYCSFGNSNQSFDHRISKNRHVYSFETDISKIEFEPGISLDINFVTNVGLKIILDLLNLDNTSYKCKVLNYLKENWTLVCNNKDNNVGGDWPDTFEHPLQISPVKAMKLDNCPHCKLKGEFYKN